MSMNEEAGMRRLRHSVLIFVALCGTCAAARGQSARPTRELRSPDSGYEFTSLVFKLRSIKLASSRTPGWSGPGEFFKLSEELLRYGSARDFERLAEDESPVVRVMGLVCLAQVDPARYAAVLPLRLGDRATVSVARDCVLYETTVGELALRLLTEPNFFGHAGGREAARS